MRWLFVLLWTAAPGFAATPALTGYPFTDESLRYSVQGLGEGRLTARHSASGWTFQFTIEAGLPSFAIRDSYSSSSSADSCSIDFTRQYSHGSKKGSEKEEVDRSHETVSRVTTSVPGGGKSEFSVPDCVKDALTFLFYTRRELGQGRVPSSQQILFGSLYDAHLVYTGPETIPVGGKPTVSDKILCSIKGPASSIDFEMYFARDPARTPLLVKLPLPLGNFSMELIR